METKMFNTFSFVLLWETLFYCIKANYGYCARKYLVEVFLKDITLIIIYSPAINAAGVHIHNPSIINPSAETQHFLFSPFL